MNINHSVPSNIFDHGGNVLSNSHTWFNGKDKKVDTGAPSTGPSVGKEVSKKELKINRNITNKICKNTQNGYVERMYIWDKDSGVTQVSNKIRLAVIDKNQTNDRNIAICDAVV